MNFNSLESEAYELYHLITNFVVKMEIRDPQVVFHFKSLINNNWVWGHYGPEVKAAVNTLILELERIREANWS